MRILFVSDSYYPHVNGVYIFVARIAALLKQNGHQVAVIAPSQSMQQTYSKVDGIDVYGIPSIPIMVYPNIRVALPFAIESRIERAIREFSPDVIHIQDHFSISKAVVKVNKKLNLPIVGTNHFMPENFTAFIHSSEWKMRFSKMLWKAFAKVYNQLSLITTPTETAAKLIRPFLHVEVLAISSGIDLQNFSTQKSNASLKQKYSIPDKPILLFIGRLDPEKNIEEILHAVALTAQKLDFCFLIVGKGVRKPSLETLAFQLGIREKVIFTGFVPEEDLPGLYRLSNCFAIASTAELLSLATLQAMASGLPVVAVNAGALHELVHDKLNGLLYNSGDIATLSDYILKVLSDHPLQKSMSAKSLEFIQDHDIQKTVLEFEAVYTSLTENPLPKANFIKKLEKVEG